MKTTENCSSSSSIDQLHLPVDVVGHLLSVLSSSDVECTRLVCQSWKQAIDHQLKSIRPLHLPPTAGAAFDGCTALHAPILRCAGQSAAAGTAAPVGLQFAWQAPHVNLNKILISVKNVNDLDLSGQMLVYDDCLQQLAQALTCLRSLKLVACKVTHDALSQLTAFSAAGRTGLTQLSLAGLTYGHEIKRPAARGLGQKGPRPAAAPGAGAVIPDNTPGVTLDDMLGAIAAQPLVDLDLSTGVVLVSLRQSCCTCTHMRPLRVDAPWHCIPQSACRSTAASQHSQACTALKAGRFSRRGGIKIASGQRQHHHNTHLGYLSCFVSLVHMRI
jgi:hypothetical protein